MKKRDQLFTLLAATGLLAFAASSPAQDQVTHFTAADGTQVTVKSDEPAPDHYGPAPAFEQLDADHNGYISRDEAQAYMPLFNDFDYLAHHANRISKRQFENWNRTQNR